MMTTDVLLVFGKSNFQLIPCIVADDLTPRYCGRKNGIPVLSNHHEIIEIAIIFKMGIITNYR